MAKPKPTRNNNVFWGHECFVDNNNNPITYAANKTETQVKNEINNAPDGARFVIYIAWKRSSSAHVFIAEKENGVVRYVDPQSGNQDASGYFQRGKPGRFDCFRLDDKQITTDITIIEQTMEGK